jgi:hypothetical protein
MASENLERELAARYHGHQRLPGEARFAEFARSLAATVFPSSPLPMDIVLLRSRRRAFENFDSSSTVTVVADQGQSDLLAMLDLLLIAQNYEPDHCLAVMQVPFAEAFRYERALERALLCAEMAPQALGQLRAIQSATAARSGHSMLAVFLLLHELAHIHVDRHASFTQWIRDEVRAGLEEYCHFNEETSARIRAGDRLPDLDTSFAGGPRGLRLNIARQMEEFVAHVTADDETVRETTCDLVAAFAFLAIRVGPVVLEPAAPPITRASLNEVGDALFLGLRASRLLMSLAFLQQYAAHIAAKSDPSVLVPAMAKLTARGNVATNIVCSRFRAIVANWPRENPNALPQSTLEELCRMFDQDIERLTARSRDRILAPIEQIGLYHRNTRMYAADSRDLKQRLFGTMRPGPRRVERALEDKLAQLPF